MFYEVFADTFEYVFNQARIENPRIAESCSAPEDIERDGSTYFVSDDLSTGYIIREDGELCFLWSAEKGRGNLTVVDAIENGATHLDCFDGYLVELYARHGFVETRREANWTPGEPDVVYMARSN